MKQSNTQKRLLELLHTRNWKQKDILITLDPICSKYGVKFNKSDISQYLSGKSEPNQDKLYVLSVALNVPVEWLMGFEVEENDTKLNYTEQTLLTNYRELNQDGQEYINKQMQFANSQADYKKHSELETISKKQA